VVELVAWRLGPHRLTVKQGHYRDRPSQKEKLRANSAATWCAPHVHCWQLWLDDGQPFHNPVREGLPTTR
jgi:hypothetical protein